MEKKKSSTNIIITELFLVKADWTRTFMGEIRRETDDYGNEIVLGVVTVFEGKIWSKASSQDELMKSMDNICMLKLNNNLHSRAGKSFPLFCTNQLLRDIIIN
jgi:hypothetical protein